MTTLYLRFALYLSLFICLTPITSSANEQGNLFSKINIYAEMANAAYQTQSEAQEIIESLDYRLDQFKRVEGVEVSYFVATNDALKHQIVSIRGTANVENAIVDLSLKLLPNKQTSITLHQGFSQAADGVYNAVLPALKKGYRTSITGHSLGGAVAVILAMYLEIDQQPLDRIVTFGQPKVTNVSGAQKFPQLDITRIVTSQDIVPIVPPLDMMDIRNLDIYWHLGKEIVLLEGDEYAELEGIKSVMRATKIVNTEMSRENLDDHKMSFYIELIKQKSKKAKLVPYETGINLFGLFGGD